MICWLSLLLMQGFCWFSIQCWGGAAWFAASDHSQRWGWYGKKRWNYLLALNYHSWLLTEAALTLATSWWSLFDWEDCSRLALSEPSYRLVGYSHYVDYHVHSSRGELQLQVWTGRALAVCWRLRALTRDWRLGALTGDWREEASCSGRTATFNSSIPLNVDYEKIFFVICNFIDVQQLALNCDLETKTFRRSKIHLP